MGPVGREFYSRYFLLFYFPSCAPTGAPGPLPEPLSVRVHWQQTEREIAAPRTAPPRSRASALFARALRALLAPLRKSRGRKRGTMPAAAYDEEDRNPLTR